MPRAHTISAVDIGGTKIAVGTIDGQGRVLSKLECPTHAHQGYAKALERIVKMIRDLGTGIDGIGIGCTGPVYPLTGEIGDVNFLPGWRGENPVRDLEQAFRVRVAMENDADAAALAEAGWAASKSRRRLVYVTVGTDWRRNHSGRASVPRRRPCAPGNRTSLDRSLRSPLPVRISRLLGIAGGWPCDGPVGGNQYVVRLPPPRQSHRQANL